MLMVSPAEPVEVKSHLDWLEHEWMSSTLPEKFGMDFYWAGADGMYGVQRKELKDFIASIRDGRLQREAGMMEQCIQPTLVIEGQVRFTTDGALIYDGWGQEITRPAFRGMLWSMQRIGISIGYTLDIKDTVGYIIQMQAWSRKDNHYTLDRRPKINGSLWGNVGNRSYEMHIMQGLPGVGPGLAKNILDHFDGVPFRWSVTEKELIGVPGIGKKKAQALYRTIKAMEGGTE